MLVAINRFNFIVFFFHFSKSTKTTKTEIAVFVDFVDIVAKLHIHLMRSEIKNSFSKLKLLIKFRLLKFRFTVVLKLE